MRSDSPFRIKCSPFSMTGRPFIMDRGPLIFVLVVVVNGVDVVMLVMVVNDVLVDVSVASR